MKVISWKKDTTLILPPTMVTSLRFSFQGMGRHSHGYVGTISNTSQYSYGSTILKYI